jgi:hypothetical protein
MAGSLCASIVGASFVFAFAGGSGSPAQAAPGEEVLLAAGDIAECDEPGDEATEAILAQQAGTVAMLGDGAYPDGSAQEYTDCYDPSWGRHKDRTRPVTGNHDYVEMGAPGYFGYFGARAGEAGKGYYSYDLGAWHIVALNSSCKEVGGCTAGSPMESWLRADLDATHVRCILAYWHHPRYFSPSLEPGVGTVDPEDKKMTHIWRDLQAAGADVVLSGHRHNYERFIRQDGDGHADAGGIREFVVGTGGGPHHLFTGPVAPGSEVRADGVWGVLRMTLRADGYAWTFLPVAGQTFTDSGQDTCLPPGGASAP